MSNKNIYILSAENDIHSLAVQKVLFERYNKEATILDFSDYPLESEMTYEWFNSEKSRLILNNNGNKIVIDENSVIWWRRPQGFYIPTDVTESMFRNFVKEECKSLLDGAFDSISCQITNDIYAQRKANNKILQLQLAKKLNFSIPKTIVTNSMVEVREFEKSINGPIIYKPQTQSKYHMADTRIVDELVYEKANLLKLTPTIFQEYIPVKYDIRVNVIKDEVFTSKINTKKHEDLIDWRLALDIEIEDYHLDNDTAEKCIKLTKELGLNSGAIDLREEPNGDIKFFEINPSGQFLFCETGSDLKITDAYSRLLLNL